MPIELIVNLGNGSGSDLNGSDINESLNLRSAGQTKTQSPPMAAQKEMVNKLHTPRTPWTSTLFVSLAFSPSLSFASSPIVTER